MVSKLYLILIVNFLNFLHMFKQYNGYMANLSSIL